MANFFDETPERRQSPRRKLVETAYIGMGPENGGLVLDVSDGGLSFQSVAPVKPAETVQFLLSIKGQSRIEGAGEVVWTDELRTVCGLRFTSLSSGAREYLNSWTSQSQTAGDAPENVISSAPQAPTQLELAPRSFASQSDEDVEPLYAIPPADVVYSSESAVRPLWREPLLYWTIFSILGGALTVASFRYGFHVGESQTSSVGKPAANSSPHKEPSLPSAPAPSSPVGNNPPTVAGSAHVNESKTKDITATPSQSPGPEVHGAAPTGQHAEQALVAAKSELAAAQASLNGENGHRDSSKAVQQLWAAVGNGNSEAEVILAGLYIKGEGVAKNCEQGRVLLMAAAKNGNAEAKVKLDELNTNGCP